MFSRNLSVPDFVRRFFVSYAQISEALALRPPLNSGATGEKSTTKASAGKTPRGHCKTKEDSGILYESLVLFLQAMFFHSHFI